MTTYLFAYLALLYGGHPAGSPGVYPLFVEFAVMESQNGLYEVPFCGIGCYTQSTVGRSGCDIIMDQTNAFRRRERLSLKSIRDWGRRQSR